MNKKQLMKWLEENIEVDDVFELTLTKRNEVINDATFTDVKELNLYIK